MDTVLTGSDYYGRAYRNALDFGWDDGYYNTLDYFEIWNEPDLQDFWPNTANQYYEMYNSVSKAVEKLDPTLPIGGPTLTTLNDDDGIEESFIKYVKENDCPLDFYAYHFYPSNNCDPYDYSRWHIIFTAFWKITDTVMYL